MADEPKWQYERAEGRYKHRWSKDYAGFVPSDRGPVGKCAKSIDQEGEFNQWLKKYGGR